MLVRRVLAGETQLYAVLVERYRDRLGRYAVRMLGELADAEDVVQETFVRGYRSLARCQPERFRFWLFGILVNRCRTHAAQRARRQNVVVSNEFLIADAAAPAIEDQHEWRRMIAAALAQLPADQREAFLLKHVEELSYDEMQELTGARVSALKMRVSRACEALRAMLREKVLD
ncbi:MAG TPA: RNA polymerase sigma factor [Longimicrobiales bacterium]